MLLRIAEHLYWMGRYLDRAETSARAFECAVERENPPDGSSGAWAGLLAMAGLGEEFRERYHAPSAADLLHFFLFDLDNPSSLLSSLKAARDNGRAACALLPPEVWESLNGIWLDLNELDQYHLLSGGITPCLTRVKEGARAIRGALDATRIQDEATRVLTLGRMLERADFLIRLLRGRMPVLVHAADVPDKNDDDSSKELLRTAGALESYRAAYHEVITPWRVIDWLILRPENPGSVRTCLDRICDCLGSSAVGGEGKAARLAYDLRGWLCDKGTGAALRQALPEQLADVADLLQRLGTEINLELRASPCA